MQDTAVVHALMLSDRSSFFENRDVGARSFLRQPEPGRLADDSTADDRDAHLWFITRTSTLNVDNDSPIARLPSGTAVSSWSTLDLPRESIKPDVEW